MNMLDIFNLFENKMYGPVPIEAINQLQEWGLIAANGSLKCGEGHTLQLQESNAIDNFVWRCRSKYQNAHKKTIYCDMWLSLRKNTFFEKSHLSLCQIVTFSYLWLENCTLQFIRKQLKISNTTAVDWASFHREVVIEAMSSERQKIGGVGKIVEVDESKFGKRKYHRGHHVEGQWVFGGVERGSGRCFMVPVESRDKETLLSNIKEWISPGTTIISDCWKAYNCLADEGFIHLTVNHSVNFKDPETGAHTNSIEGMWRHMKASLPVYCRKKKFFKGYIAKYMFLKKCKADDVEPFVKFFKYAGELYSPSFSYLNNDSSDDEDNTSSDDEDI